MSKLPFEAILEAIPLPLFLTDAQKILLWCNAVGRQILPENSPSTGFSFSEKSILGPAQSEKKVGHFDSGSSLKQYSASSFAVGSEGHVVWLFVDQSEERKKLLSQIQESAISAVGFLSSGLAHEFRNILASVDGRAQIAVYKNDIENYQKLVQLVRQQSRRGANLVRNLMTFSNSLRVRRKEYFALDQLISQAISMVQKELEHSGIRVEVELEEHLFAHIHVSEIQQSLLNLIQNAAESFIESQGTLRIVLEKAESKAQIKILDNGRGIPQKDLDKIFQPFFTTKGHGSSQPQYGSGLGITVALNCIREHRGSIKVESELKVGTCVTILIPLS